MFNVGFGQNFASCTYGKTVTNRITHSEVFYKKATLILYGVLKEDTCAGVSFLIKL